YAPGLLQCFSATDEETATDCRPARLMALHLPANAAPSPFTGQGSTRVEWRGFLDIDLADDFTFSIEGRGRFTLTLGGKEIFDSSGEDLSKEKAVTVELDSGKVPLLAVYTGPPAGARELRLFWSSFDWQREPVPPMVLFHDPADKAASESAALRQGRELFARLRCVKCHPGINISKTSMPELSRDAPSLLAAGKKFRQDWLARWIENPRSSRRQATMPRLLHGAGSRENARDIAAWLASMGKPGKSRPAASPEIIKKGGELFADLGCFNCHTLRKAEAAGAEDANRISLRNIGEKWRPRALEEFLLDPDRDYKWIRMGDLQLKAPEAEALVAFLLSLPGDPQKAQAFKRPPNPARGKELAEKLRCANCHQLAEEKEQADILYPATNNIEALKKGGFKGGCLSSDPPGRH
ncbi:MAG: cytochrome c, partial [Planctomycetes bacterium]|nr:cytochrome c [Planctomycetota bacterium]